ncbi:helix-turn-helix domain-containing protein [Streptosporangium sp. NBC_01469]|uniref:helix-turn-helix domain-containing protein n=1 Tax=Streptosporangium sp. NBC_01469 TaxID=2903898 RepID=UPI003FCED4EA
MSTVQFAALLLRYRRRTGITQQQLADLSTVSARAIRDLEKGRARHPRRTTVRLLADALRIDDHERDILERSADDRPDDPDFLDPVHDFGREHLFEYKTLCLQDRAPTILDDDHGADALNDAAKEGWRLIAVDHSVAFLERDYSDAYTESASYREPSSRSCTGSGSRPYPEPPSRSYTDSGSGSIQSPPPARTAARPPAPTPTHAPTRTHPHAPPWRTASPPTASPEARTPDRPLLKRNGTAASSRRSWPPAT